MGGKWDTKQSPTRMNNIVENRGNKRMDRMH